MNAVSIRGDWVGQTIDGRFPLLEWLGSGVFVTEIDSERAAIKLVPASARAEDRLANWNSAASLSHPHLMRILDSGRAEIEGAGLIYVVTEPADEVLSQIIPERPLTSQETREMLGPVLDALAYLHGRQLVHGHVRPSNILVVKDQVKLAADGLISAGKPAPEPWSNDVHNAPEAGRGPASPMADVWSLGVTLVEALTQQTPVWDSASRDEPAFPDSIPRPFAEIVRECLRVDPARRCTIDDIRAMLEARPRPAGAKPEAQAPETSEAQVEATRPHLPHHPHRLAERSTPAKIPLVPLIVGFVLLIAIIVGLQMHSRRTRTAGLQTEKTTQAPPAEPGPVASLPEPSAGGTIKGAPLKRVLPDVPRGASNTIRGTVKVAVRVSVNATGAVTNAELASRGPSAYFARLALESARDWTFKPPMQGGRDAESTWLLHYEFRRGGVDVTATQATP